MKASAPSVYSFTGEACTRAYKLNRFAFDCKYPGVRQRFADDPDRTRRTPGSYSNSGAT